ncbi:MAG: prolyl oligopeptidase family serine peptidase [Saprospiraceae bacterium]|nr:prolyl oligopeptidase family serine peptidase [Saprospiraceae bacterium]
MMRQSAFILLLIFLAGCGTVKHYGLTAERIKTKTGWEMPYNIYYPKNYGKEKVPLFIWLHGSGERGDDNVSQLIHIVPYLASDITQIKYPCIVLAPQCPKEEYWAPIKKTEWRIINDSEVTKPMSGVMELIDKLLKDPKIDKNRVYLGGLSMGGFGTLDLLSRRPQLFAGAVPICGGADLGKATNYKDVPVWVFHGAKDTAVPVQFSRDLISVLKEAGGDPKYTEYPDGGHDVWNKAIREPELLKWLFTQVKH